MGSFVIAIYFSVLIKSSFKSSFLGSFLFGFCSLGFSGFTFS